MTELTTQPTSVYLYFDERDVMIYVGITARSVVRNREHNRDKQWWRFVARQEVEHFPTRIEAGRRETELIRLHRPPFNTAQNPDAESARSTYLSFINSVSLGLDPVVLAKSMYKRLPLVALQAGPEHKQWIFRSEPEHINLARELGLDYALNVNAVDGFRMGRLISIEQHGAHSIFRFHIRSGTPAMKCSDAEVRFCHRQDRQIGASLFVIQRVIMNASRLTPPTKRKRKRTKPGSTPKQLGLAASAPEISSSTAT